MKNEIIVATSGYFQPLHSGHLQLFRDSKKLGDKLIVIINSDKQSMMKHGYSFMPEKERAEIIKDLKYVDDVMISIDEDRTQCKTLAALKPNIFTKGGDRNSNEIPEKKICDELGIQIIDGVGGCTKVQSSSELIKKAIDKIKQEENKYIQDDEMCSKCRGHADIIEYPIKLCNSCNKSRLKNEK